MIRNIRIALRTAITLALLGSTTLFLGLFSNFQLSKLNDVTDLLTLERIPLLMELSEIRREVLLTQVKINELSDTQTKDEVTNLQQDIKNLADSYKESEIKALSIPKSSDSELILNNISNLHNQLLDKLPELYSLTINGDIKGSVEYRTKFVLPIAIEIRKQLDLISKNERNHTEKINNDATDTYLNSRTLILSGIVISILFFIVMAYFYSRSLIIPLRQAVVIAQNIAEGDLTQSFSDHNNDEAADLLRALTQMQNSLRDVLLLIRDSSHQLAATSEELSAITHQSSEVVTSQRDEITQAATAISQLTIAVDEVARTASETKDNAQVVNDKTQSGKVKIVQTINTIDALKAELNVSELGVGELAAKINNISSVLDVIRDIADQTNLLALNAAIEAARAGENGRGFAVVADEVRALAHRTQVSTKDIETMISSITAETEIAVHNMQKSHNSAVATLNVANDAGAAFEEISSLIGDINMQNTMIANAAEEQASVSKDVNTNLTHIRDLSIQTSSGAEETNASSVELAKLAVHLNELVMRFKL